MPFNFYALDPKKYNGRYCWICDFNKTLHIFCFLRIGLAYPDKENLDYLKDIVKSKFFSGGLIGKNKSALFLIGMQNNNFIYLDPHFVQESEFKNISKHLNSFNCLNFRTIEDSKINPCLGISFTVWSFDDCLQLQSFLDKMKEKHRDSYYICFNSDKESDCWFN